MVGNNINNNINNTSYNQPKSNKKTIILVKEKDENLNEHEHKFHEFNNDGYNLVIINYNEILNYLLSNSIDEINIKNIEMIILIIPIHYHVINNLPTIVKDIRKSLLPNQQIFFILPSESVLQNFLSMGLCKLEDIRIQPFSVFDILDLIAVNKRKERITQAKLQDHVISSYPSLQHEIKDLIEFLTKGIENNETTLLLLNKDTYQQNYLKSLLKSHDLDMDKLSDDGLLMTFLNEDWYLSFDGGTDNKKKIVTVNKEIILLKWNNLIDQVINNGKRGLRAFCMTDCFFEYGLVEELIDYECLIHPKLHTSILPLCAYRDEDLIKLSDDQIKKLVGIHHNVWL